MTSLPATRIGIIESPSPPPPIVNVAPTLGGSGRGQRRGRRASAHRDALHDPRLKRLLVNGGGHLAPRAVDVNFNDMPCQTLDKHSVYEFGELVIDTGGEDLLIEQLDEERVLTGVKGRHIECRVLFRHAYGRMICRLGVDALTADTHLGLLESRTLEEIQAFSFTRPRHARRKSGGRLWTHIEYYADPLSEIQGFVWRGGSLKLASFTLMP